MIILLSFFLLSFLLDVEVLDLVVLLVGGHHVQELPQAVLFQVPLGQVLQVPLREVDSGIYGHFPVVAGDLDVVAELAELAVDLDVLAEVLCEVGGVEDLVLDGLGAVDAEVEVHWLFVLGLHCGDN